MFWDDAVHDRQGNPAPHGDHDWMVERAQAMFDAMHPQLGEFFRLMRDAKLTDLKNRDGKAGGGFCTSFPTLRAAVHFCELQRHASTTSRSSRTRWGTPTRATPAASSR